MHNAQGCAVLKGMLDVKMKIYSILICNPGSVIRFSQSTYRVNENDELVQPALVLSSPSSSEITVQVNDNGITATGELIHITNYRITLLALQEVMIIILDHILSTFLLNLLEYCLMY